MSRHVRHEQGSATIFVLAMSVVLMLCAGLVIDGGMGINARMRVGDDAEQAARAGANAVDLTTLRSGGSVVIDPGLARSYTQDYLSARGYDSSQFDISVTANSVSVVVRDTSETHLLKLIMIDEYPVQARATATAVTS